MDRSEKRRQAKEDRALLERGIAPDGIGPQVVYAVMRETSRELRRSIETGSINPVIEFINRQFELSARWLKDVPKACGKGCWYCCTAWVASPTPVGIYFAKSMPGNQKRPYRERLDALMVEIEGLSFDERENLVTRCAGLEGDACANYTNRPPVCRTATSIDADVCRRSYVELSGEDVPTPAAPLAIRSVYSTALAVASEFHGLDGRGYELNAVASCYLSDPRVEQRWLMGETVMAGTPEDPVTEGDLQANRQFVAEAFDGW